MFTSMSSTRKIGCDVEHFYLLFAFLSPLKEEEREEPRTSEGTEGEASFCLLL
jgi:hypothetical protein